ncbi:hypothetical protein SAMN05428938_6939 [Streptomyces sp. KS_5]|nr:hypothetical protein SAMN05428938_6939 [Streptomyces sp. KS_5]
MSWPRMGPLSKLTGLRVPPLRMHLCWVLRTSRLLARAFVIASTGMKTVCSMWLSDLHF